MPKRVRFEHDLSRLNAAYLSPSAGMPRHEHFARCEREGVKTARQPPQPVPAGVPGWRTPFLIAS